MVCTRSALFLLALSLLLLGTTPVEPRRLYLGPGALLGSSRVVALGGAYTGIAEGIPGMTSNLAAIAHRRPRLARGWDLGAGLSLPQVPFGDSDLDNDGTSDQSQRRTQLLTGLFLQYGWWGVGTYLRSATFSTCADPGCEEKIFTTLQEAALGVGLALHDDNLVIAAGIHAATTTFTFQKVEWAYAGSGLELDALLRPTGQPFRLGIALKPQLFSPFRPKAGQPLTLAGRPIHPGILNPGVISLGVSRRFGEGSQNYNRLSRQARREKMERDGAENTPPAPLGRESAGELLLSAQVDLVEPVEHAFPLQAFLVPGSAGGALQAELSGAPLLVPRLGAEHETFPRRLRTRLGTYLEPSPFAFHLPRPHLTGGFELRLFRLMEDWSFSTSFDFAARYLNAGFSFGFWG